MSIRFNYSGFPKNVQLCVEYVDAATVKAAHASFHPKKPTNTIITIIMGTTIITIITDMITTITGTTITIIMGMIITITGMITRMANNE